MTKDILPLPQEMRKTTRSPLNRPVWLYTLLTGAGSLLAVLLRVLFEARPASIPLLAVITFASFFLSVTLVLMETARKKFWYIWLAGGGLFLIFSRPEGNAWVATVCFLGVFFTFRRYRVYRHLTSRRRAVVFIAGLMVFFLLTVVWSVSGGPVSGESLESGPAGYLWNYTLTFLWGLRFFWFFSLFSLFFSIRLHFLRIRPKLAVTTFLLCVVPVILITMMGLVILVATLGESRAIHARMLFLDWMKKAADTPAAVQAFSRESFSFSSDSQKGSEKKIPVWTQDLIDFLAEKKSIVVSGEKNGAAFYVWVGKEIWLVRWERRPPGGWRLDGSRLTEEVMDRMAVILRSDVELKGAYSAAVMPSSVEADNGPGGTASENSTLLRGRMTREEKTGGEKNVSLWRRPFYYGVGQLDVTSLDQENWKSTNVVIVLRSGVNVLLGEFFSERNPLGLVVMTALAVLAVLMFLFEALALYFGLRITGGITSAVKALHRATGRIAEGDLDIKIEVPNEDELGDLAASFNAMAAAVKRGREQEVEKERLERDLKTAREIQEKLLPHSMPDVPGYEITGTSIPSRQVGGDYFDFIETSAGRLGVAIADVSGKGIPAALLMSNLQASLHAQVFEKGDVSLIVKKMNDLLVRSTDSHMFVTFFMGILDRAGGRFTSVNAGHNPPFLLDKRGNIVFLKEGGLLLGFMPEQTYKHQSVLMKEGDVLVLYTDGITEAAGKEKGKRSEIMYGENRLIETVKKARNGSARDIQSAVLESVSRYAGNDFQEDDITLVVIKRTEKAGDSGNSLNKE